MTARTLLPLTADKSKVWAPPTETPLKYEEENPALVSAVKPLDKVKELVSLPRRCANNLNQVAIHANAYGIYQSEISGLQKDYTELWGRVSDVLKQLMALVEL